MAARLVNVALGIFLLAAPDLLGYEGPARVSHLIVGPLAASVAVMAIAETLRELRWLNLGLGAWLVISPLLIPHGTVALGIGVVTGMAITALAVVQGPLKHNTGGGWPAVVRPNTDKRHHEGGSHD